MIHRHYLHELKMRHELPEDFSFDGAVHCAARLSPSASRLTGRTVLSLCGEVDLDSDPLIADAVDEAMDGGALELWLDVAHVEFMDSAGVHLLVETRARLRELNRRLAVLRHEVLAAEADLECASLAGRGWRSTAGNAGAGPKGDDRTTSSVRSGRFLRIVTSPA